VIIKVEFCNQNNNFCNGNFSSYPVSSGSLLNACNSLNTINPIIGNRINSPVGDYITDNRVNSFTDDPHATVYISNTVNLVNPSSSLRVILSAYRPANSDFRVLYSLIRPDSSEVTQSFELFPGYDNLTIDMNQDGYLDVVDPSRNSGLPDVRVPASLENQFLEYEYTASNLGSFTGYTIKIVMSSRDQSRVPIFKDLRSIAIV
jgi:hypothetical protein